jgi:hypothetical protein
VKLCPGNQNLLVAVWTQKSFNSRSGVSEPFKEFCLRGLFSESASQLSSAFCNTSSSSPT